MHTLTHPYAPSQDLSLRAFLKGWQFVWCYDMECPNEIPSDYKAYRKQQRRWSCGPMQLWAAARQSVRRSTLQPRCNHRAGGCDPMHPGCNPMHPGCVTPMHPGYDPYACRWVTATPYIHTQVGDSTLPLLHKSYLNIFFFGVRMLATNVISFTFYR